MNPRRLTLVTVVVAVLVVAGILIVPRLGGPAAEAADIDVSGQPTLGAADAPVTWSSSRTSAALPARTSS